MSVLRTSIPLVALLLGAALSAQAQHAIPTKPHVNPDYYAWVTSLSPSPATTRTSGPDSVVHARAYRVAILTSEIYSTILIETITYGEEGCCARLASAKALDEDALRNAFHLRGEFAGAQFRRWVSPATFEFSINGHLLSVTNLDRDTVTVTEVSQH